MTRATLLVVAVLASVVRAEDLGLKIPPGFRVTLFADHTLANDIFTMALDEKGRVVVSGPGYIRRLEDTDGDGRADKAVSIAATRTGAMGLLFAYDSYHPETFDLYVASEGQIRGHNGDHDGHRYPPYQLLLKTFPFSEHGGHALKVGPDGFLYAIAGNDGRVADLPRSRTSPVTRPEAGGIFRYPSWERPGVEVVAHGFRNPYDFDFTPLGDIITYDSDTERDALLPWYTPTRVFHVMEGGHHGWRLPGYTRSLARPAYYPDAVEPLAEIGRGSPTGVCCYRHTQFPPKYRGGVFVLDWTFGKVWYLPLVPEGSSYARAEPEVFLEPIGMNGFAPTAARVAPDGSLFISIGGRGTRGAVYRVEYCPNGGVAVMPRARPECDLDRVLDAPQPQEAWSEAEWIPLASTIEPDAFERIAVCESESDARRIRAIEILVRRKRTGLHSSVAVELMKSRSPVVRARLACGLGLGEWSRAIDLLWTLAGDPSPRVRVAALTAMVSREMTEWGVVRLDDPTLQSCLSHSDRRVRLAAANVLARLVSYISSVAPREVWARFERLFSEATDSRALVTLILAYVKSAPPASRRGTDLLFPAMTALNLARSPAERLDAIRAIMLAQDDWNLSSPRVELFSAYALNGPSLTSSAYFRLLMHGIEKDLLNGFPSADERENMEVARLLAMTESDEPRAVTKVLARITRRTHPTHDFHYLTVLSRLTAPRNIRHNWQVADALLGMDAKLEGRQLRIKQNWDVRLGELAAELLKNHPGLDKVLVAHAELVKPGHIVIASQLAGEARTAAARRFLAALRKDADFGLTPELVHLIGGLSPEEHVAVFRARWTERAAREAMLPYLAAKPDADDRDRFVDMLESGSPPAVQSAVKALMALRIDPNPDRLVPALTRLRQAFSDPKEVMVRKELLALVNRQTGQTFAVTESKTDANSLATAYRPVFEFFERTYPNAANRLNAAGDDEAAVRKLVPSVQWDTGNVERGRKLYRDRGCQSCHEATSRIGPDLAGVSKRFSRDDLLTAIVNPSRDVAPAYRVSNVDLKDGRRVSGVVVFESAEGVIVQTGTAETRRIATEDIESRTPSPKSLMPDGLLKGLKAEELADLFAFLGAQ